MGNDLNDSPGRTALKLTTFQKHPKPVASMHRDEADNRGEKGGQYLCGDIFIRFFSLS